MIKKSHYNIIYGCLLLMALTLLISACKKIDYENNRTSFFKNLRSSNDFIDTTVTVMTFNIQLGFKNGKDPWDKNTTGATEAELNEVVGIIQRTNSSIVMLQEVPLNRENTVIRNSLEYIAQKLNYNYAFGSHGYSGPVGINPKGEWGCAILTKFKINDIENIEIYNSDKWNKRSVLKANILINASRSMDVYSAHFHLNDIDRQFQQISPMLKSTTPYFFGGDFNDVWDNQRAQQLGIDSTKVDEAIKYLVDLIFYQKQYFEIRSSEHNDTTAHVSDHLPCYAVFKVK